MYEPESPIAGEPELGLIQPLARNTPFSGVAEHLREARTAEKGTTNMTENRINYTFQMIARVRGCHHNDGVHHGTVICSDEGFARVAKLKGFFQQ